MIPQVTRGARKTYDASERIFHTKNILLPEFSLLFFIFQYENPSLPVLPYLPRSHNSNPPCLSASHHLRSNHRHRPDRPAQHHHRPRQLRSTAYFCPHRSRSSLWTALAAARTHFHHPSTIDLSGQAQFTQ